MADVQVKPLRRFVSNMSSKGRPFLTQKARATSRRAVASYGVINNRVMELASMCDASSAGIWVSSVSKYVGWKVVDPLESVLATLGRNSALQSP